MRNWGSSIFYAAFLTSTLLRVGSSNLGLPLMVASPLALFAFNIETVAA